MRPEFDLYATFNPKLMIQSTIESFKMEFEHMNKCKRKTNENWNITNNIKKFAIVYDLFMTQILDQDIFNVKVNKLENILVE